MATSNSSSTSPLSSKTPSPTRQIFPATTFSITIPPNQQRFDSKRDSPGRKRHASLDGGHFRYRSVSSRDSSIYLSPFPTPLESEKGKAFDFDQKHSRNRSPSRGVKLGVGILGLLLLGIVFNRGTSDREAWSSARRTIATLVGADIGGSPPSCDNPYSELGRLAVDTKVPENNRWRPYDPTCAPPPFLATLRKALRTKSDSDQDPAVLSFPLPRLSSIPSKLPLPWLRGKTVLLFGDHVERDHNEDFCRFAGGQFGTIGRDHPLSPPRFVNGIDEKLSGANVENHNASRPAVCYIPEYDFALVSVFHYGLANRVEIERETLLEDPNFYPPVALEDRLTHIVLPILDTLNRTRPDLIEFSTGFWDLRHFAALDDAAKVDPFGELSTQRLTWFGERLTRAFADLADAFPHTPLLWRSIHQIPEQEASSPARVAALDALSRKIIAFLNDSPTVGDARDRIAQVIDTDESLTSSVLKRHESGARTRTPFRDRGSGRAKFLNKVKSRIGSSDRMHDVVFGSDSTTLKGKITIDEWTTLMRGQERWRDDIHTAPLPGGYLWSDMMLFFLERLSSAPHFRP